MYLGAHGQANALDVLLDAARIVKERGYDDIRFVLIGDGPEKPRLIKMSKELGLENVEFRNPVPKSNVPDVLREADAFLLTWKTLQFSDTVSAPINSLISWRLVIL